MIWVVDLDGVVWLAGKAIPGSAAAVERLRDAGNKVVFVTNNSTPTLADHLSALARVGITAGEQELVTSAQAAASMLAPGSRASFVGGPGIQGALEARGVEVVDPSEHPEAVVVGRTTTLDFRQLSAAAAAIRQGARFIAANTDATFPTPAGLEPGAGALVAFLEAASGRKAESAGKPARPMATLLEQRYGSPTVVVGDRPDTDGLLASLLQAEFALVLSGVTSPSDLPVAPEPQLIGADLAEVVATVLDRTSPEGDPEQC